MHDLTLYSAAEQVRSLLEQVDDETGELPEALGDALELVAQKSQQVAAFILSNNAEADFVEAHAKALLERVKAARKRSDWLRQYLQAHMTGCGIREIKGDDGTFRATLHLDRDESVEVFDLEQVPFEYMRSKTTVTADKTAIKEALRNNIEVPGAKIVKNDRLTIK